MENKRISIIIPVYNVEKYIEKCLNSIISQDYSNFEVILIDDGSKDSSSKICDEYSSKYKNFRCVHQDNQGVSAARNTGLTMADGDLITFVDADDWVEKDFCATINSNIGDNDILMFDGVMCNGQMRKANCFWKDSRRFVGDEKELLQAQAISFAYRNEYNPTYHGAGIAWGKAYSRKLIDVHKLRFPIGLKMSEDAIFALYAFQYASSIMYIKKSIYCYRTDNISASRSFDSTYIETNEHMIAEFSKFITGFGTKITKDALKHRMVVNLNLIMQNYVFSNENHNPKQDYLRVRELDWVQALLKKMDIHGLSRQYMFVMLCVSRDNYECLKLFYGFKKGMRKWKHKIGI